LMNRLDIVWVVLHDWLSGRIEHESGRSDLAVRNANLKAR
jgi:hypothetical protein